MVDNAHVLFFFTTHRNSAIMQLLRICGAHEPSSIAAAINAATVTLSCSQLCGLVCEKPRSQPWRCLARKKANGIFRPNMRYRANTQE